MKQLLPLGGEPPSISSSCAWPFSIFGETRTCMLRLPHWQGFNDAIQGAFSPRRNLFVHRSPTRFGLDQSLTASSRFPNRCPNRYIKRSVPFSFSRQRWTCGQVIGCPSSSHFNHPTHWIIYCPFSMASSKKRGPQKSPSPEPQAPLPSRRTRAGAMFGPEQDVSDTIPCSPPRSQSSFLVTKHLSPATGYSNRHSFSRWAPLDRGCGR